MPLKCPNCGQDVKIPDHAYINVDTYRQAKLVRTECCGHGVYLSSITVYQVLPCFLGVTQDAWGAPITPTPLPPLKAPVPQEIT